MREVALSLSSRISSLVVTLTTELEFVSVAGPLVQWEDDVQTFQR